MNVAPDRIIILGLQIVLDHRLLSSIGQKILMILHIKKETTISRILIASRLKIKQRTTISKIWLASRLQLQKDVFNPN